MTSLQQEPSAHRPWAKTIVGFADAGISLSDAAAPGEQAHLSKGHYCGLVDARKGWKPEGGDAC
jgi:hypothetical protein